MYFCSSQIYSDLSPAGLSSLAQYSAIRSSVLMWFWRQFCKASLVNERDNKVISPGLPEIKSWNMRTLSESRLSLHYCEIRETGLLSAVFQPLMFPQGMRFMKCLLFTSYNLIISLWIHRMWTHTFYVAATHLQCGLHLTERSHGEQMYPERASKDLLFFFSLRPCLNVIKCYVFSTDCFLSTSLPDSRAVIHLCSSLTQDSFSGVNLLRVRSNLYKCWSSMLCFSFCVYRL